MSVGLDLKDDATREDVQSMVKEYMEERAEVEGKTEKKDIESKKTSAGDDDSAGDDAVAGDEKAGGEGSEGEEAKQSKDWLTDEVRSELPRWVSDKDLEGFSSRDELDRALGLIDRAALQAGRESGEKGGEGEKTSGDTGQRGQERGKDGKFRKQQEPEGKADDSAKPFEIDLDLSDFDDELSEKVKGVLTGLRDHYEGRLTSLDARFAAIEAANQEREAQAVEAQFDAIVDSLGHADLFGQAGQETEKQLGARRTLFDELHVYLTGLKTLGREGRMDKASVARVLHMAFADHISKQELKNRTKSILRQSNMRTNVGAERPAEQPFKGPLKNHPEVRRAYKELQDARGAE